MSLFIASLNSGSNGNCYYIGNDREAVFIDAGISCRETELRMKQLGLSMDKVKAIFVSHEHSDHISGIPTLVKKYQIPVYITKETLRSRKLYLDKKLILFFETDETVTIGGLAIKSFSKAHDAADPHSFTVSGNGVTIGVFTDIGVPCDNLAAHLQQCHAAFLESNYDEEMLANGRYPYFLKSRITNGKGHLSNRQAREVFVQNRPSFMTHLLLSHLSHDNNNPELVLNLFREAAPDMKVVIASRHAASQVFHIGGDAADVVEIPAAQLSLFTPIR